MSVKDHLLAGCQNKKAYATGAAAYRAMAFMARRRHRWFAQRIYRCRFCQHWHVGTTQGKSYE